MKIAYIADWYPANFNRFLSLAFEEAGHTVERHGRIFPNHYGIEWGEAEKFFWDVCPLPDTHIDLSAFDADLIFLSDCRSDFPVTGKPSCPVALYEPEGWNHWYRRNIIKGVVAAFTPMPYGVMYEWYDPDDKDRCAMDDGWIYLPGAWLESVHPKGEIDPQNRYYDFVSHALPYNFRPRMVDYLSIVGNNVRCAYGHVNIEGYVKNHHNALTTCDSHEGQEYVKWRVFEAGGLGTVLLHSRCRLMDLNGYIPGFHYVEIPQVAAPVEVELGRVEPDFDAILNVIYTLRDNPKIALQFIERHHELIRSRHTYAHRVQTVLEEVGLWN